MWNLKKRKRRKKIQTQKDRTDQWLPEVGDGGWVKRLEELKRYKLPVINK